MSHTSNSAEVLALEACSELETLLANDTTQITAIDKKDAVVRAIAQLRVAASGLSNSSSTSEVPSELADSLRGIPSLAFLLYDTSYQCTRFSVFGLDGCRLCTVFA